LELFQRESHTSRSAQCQPKTCGRRSPITHAEWHNREGQPSLEDKRGRYLDSPVVLPPKKRTRYAKIEHIGKTYDDLSLHEAQDSPWSAEEEHQLEGGRLPGIRCCHIEQRQTTEIRNATENTRDNHFWTASDSGGRGSSERASTCRNCIPASPWLCQDNASQRLRAPLHMDRVRASLYSLQEKWLKDVRNELWKLDNCMHDLNGMHSVTGRNFGPNIYEWATLE
jgi:hypothetical protein